MNKFTLGIFIIAILLIANLLNSVYGTGPILTSEIFEIDSNLLLIFSGLVVPFFSLLIVFWNYRKKKSKCILVILFILVFLCLANIYWVLYCGNNF